MEQIKWSVFKRKALGTPGSEEGLKKLDVQVFIEEPEAVNA